MAFTTVQEFVPNRCAVWTLEGVTVFRWISPSHCHLTSTEMMICESAVVLLGESANSPEGYHPVIVSVWRLLEERLFPVGAVVIWGRNRHCTAMLVSCWKSISSVLLGHFNRESFDPGRNCPRLVVEWRSGHALFTDFLFSRRIGFMITILTYNTLFTNQPIYLKFTGTIHHVSSGCLIELCSSKNVIWQLNVLLLMFCIFCVELTLQIHTKPKGLISVAPPGHNGRSCVSSLVCPGNTLIFVCWMQSAIKPLFPENSNHAL